MDYLRNCFQETYVRQLPFQSTHALYWDLHERMKAPLSGLMRSLQQVSHRALLKMHFTRDLQDVWKPHFRIAYERLLGSSDKIYVVRDGRDVLVSYFHFRMRFDGGTDDFAAYLRTPLRPGGRTVARYWADHVAGWLSDPNVYVVRFEALRHDFANAVTRLGESLCLTRNSRPIQAVQTDKRRWIRAIKRAFGAQESTAVLPGAGQIGAWRAHFSESDERLFMQEAGQVLSDLGYDKPMR